MAKLTVRFKEKFYHYDLGRLPKGNDKAKPVDIDERYIPELPSNTVILKATDEQKAQFADVLKAREAAREGAKNAARVKKETDVMSAFVSAMSAMNAKASADAEVEAKAPRRRPAKAEAEVE